MLTRPPREAEARVQHKEVTEQEVETSNFTCNCCSPCPLIEQTVIVSGANEG